MVGRHDARAEAVPRAQRVGHGVFGTVDGFDDNDWTEGLLAADGRFRRRVRKDRGLEDAPDCIAAGDEAGARRNRLLDSSIDRAHGAVADQRTYDDSGSGGIAGCQCLYLGREARDKLVMQWPFDQYLARIHADLALMKERAERREIHGVLHVRIAQDQQWVVAAQFQDDPLQCLSCTCRQHSADGR